MTVEIGHVRVEIIRFVEYYQPGIIEFKLTDAFGRHWYFIEKQPYVGHSDLGYEASYPQSGWLECAVIGRFTDGTGRHVVRIDTKVLIGTWHASMVSSIEGEHVFEVLADRMDFSIELFDEAQSIAPPRDFAGGPHPVEFHFQRFPDKSTMSSHVEEQNIADVIEESHAVNWGYFALPNSRVIVVGFNQTGLTPKGMIFDGHLYVGIGGFCACYELVSASRRFIYHLPTLFHEFVRFTPWLIVRAEIDFIGLDTDGKQIWSGGLGDIITGFEMVGNRLSGQLIDNGKFTLNIPDWPVLHRKE